MFDTAHGRKLLVLLVAGATLIGVQRTLSIRTHSASNTNTNVAANTAALASGTAAETPPPSTADLVPQVITEKLALAASIREEHIRLDEERLAREAEERRQEEERQQQEQAARDRMVASSRGEERGFIDFPLSHPSGVSADELDQAFEGTAMAGLGQAFIQAETNYNVNAVGLAAIAIHESGWGASKYARERNNMFGLGAWTEDPDHAFRYATKAEGVLAAAQHLSRNYLTSGGRYYRGGTPRAVGVIYADGSQSWAIQVSTIMAKLMHSMGR